MNETRTNPVVRLLPSLGDFAFLLPLAFLFGRMEGAPALLADSDTGWQLRAGEWILANRTIPDRDLFSYTRPGAPWFAWEWLWDVLFAGLARYGGLAAVVLANVALLCIVAALTYRLARRASGNAPVALAVTLLATVASSMHWLARPHILTLLMVAIFANVLLGKPDRRRMAVLAGLTVLWTNLHGGFPAGVTLVALYGAGELIAALVAGETDVRREALRRARIYGAGAAACAAASLVNPYGWRLHAHIVEYFRDPWLLAQVNEFLPLNFRHPVSGYFEFLLLAAAGAALWSLSARRFAQGVTVLAWAHLALFSARHIPIFVIVAAPVVAQAAAEWLAAVRTARVAGWVRAAAESAVRAAEEIGALERIGRAHVSSVAGLALVAALLYAPASPERFRAAFPPDLFPVKAAAALGCTGPMERVFTGDQWGGYLIYSQYPARRVFVDGRSDFYGRDIGKTMQRIWMARDGWQTQLEQHGVDAVLVPPTAPLAAAMKESARWRAVYDDGFAIVFRAVRDAGSEGAQQFSMAKSGHGTERGRAISGNENRSRAATNNNHQS